jgi:hypothetical protein
LVNPAAHAEDAATGAIVVTVLAKHARVSTMKGKSRS